MFSSSKKQNPSAGNSCAPSIISQGLTITGNLVSTGDMQIDGSVIGDIAGQKIVIGETARIDGDIQADDVMVRGEVNGRIRAQSVALARSAKVVGDVIHRAMSMEAGARLDGHVRQVEDPRERPPVIPGLLKDINDDLRPLRLAGSAA
jgi:cytoskeletal protein CcmA (bactofilin family)